MRTPIQLLIKAMIASVISHSAAYAFEGAEMWINLFNLNQLQTKETLPVVEPEPIIPAEMLEELRQAENDYFVVRDEVEHILPLFVGALEGVGAGAVFNKSQLLEICSEVTSQLKSSSSCEHAANIASGLRKEAIWRLRERRAEHKKEVLAKLRAIEQGIEEKKSVASSMDHIEKTQAIN